MFAQLSKPHVRPTKLEKLRWFHEETSEPHALEAFEGLLDALSGLKILHVDINNIPGLPRASAIAHHGQTLQMLGVRSRMPHSAILMYESEQFDEICTNCLELRQLSVTFPPTSVSNASPSADFKTYLVSFPIVILSIIFLTQYNRGPARSCVISSPSISTAGLQQTAPSSADLER